LRASQSNALDDDIYLTLALIAIGIAPHVVDRILKHASGTISGVARIYNRHEYLAER
jgi:hypothetical protein